MSLVWKFNLTHLNLTLHAKIHNKCNIPECRYSNPPQASEGKYDCGAGSSEGFHCGGTYIVSRTAADKVMRLHKESLGREAEAERLAQSKAHQSANARRASLLEYQRDEQARKLGAADLGAIYEMENLGGKTSGRQLEWRIAQHNYGDNEGTPDFTSYHPRLKKMPQSCAIQTLTDARDYFGPSVPGASPINQRNDTPRSHSLPLPLMSHQRVYLTHPTFRT